MQTSTVGIRLTPRAGAILRECQLLKAISYILLGLHLASTDLNTVGTFTSALGSGPEGPGPCVRGCCLSQMFKREINLISLGKFFERSVTNEQTGIISEVPSRRTGSWSPKTESRAERA